MNKKYFLICETLNLNEGTLLQKLKMKLVRQGKIPGTPEFSRALRDAYQAAVRGTAVFRAA